MKHPEVDGGGKGSISRNFQYSAHLWQISAQHIVCMQANGASCHLDNEKPVLKTFYGAPSSFLKQSKERVMRQLDVLRTVHRTLVLKVIQHLLEKIEPDSLGARWLCSQVGEISKTNVSDVYLDL